MKIRAKTPYQFWKKAKSRIPKGTPTIPVKSIFLCLDKRLPAPRLETAIIIAQIVLTAPKISSFLKMIKSKTPLKTPKATSQMPSKNCWKRTRSQLRLRLWKIIWFREKFTPECRGKLLVVKIKLTMFIKVTVKKTKA